MSFCDNLKKLRKEQKIGQQELADKLSVSVKTVSHWETSYTEPSISQLIAIANYFEITLDELVDRT